VTGDRPGRELVAASWTGVVAHGLIAAGAVLTPSLRGGHTVAAAALFVGGMVAMGAAIVKAALRSRTDLIGIGGLFFAAGSAPRRTALLLQAALGFDVVIAFAAAGARPLTSLAFSVLVPLWPLGVMGLWCARHGTFALRR
jgi:hypothetical protein